MDEFNFFEHKELVEAFQKNKPYLVDLETLIKEIKYGKIHLVFTVTNSRVISMEVGSQQLIRYDKGERLNKSS